VQTILVIVPDEILQDTPQVFLAECDDVVEDLSPAVANPPRIPASALLISLIWITDRAGSGAWIRAEVSGAAQRCS
jgi:hypothetical protein